MGWICTKAMSIMRAGKKTPIAPGEPVPEADHWDNAKAWERQGYIRWVDRATPLLSVPKSVPVSVDVGPKSELLLEEPKDEEEEVTGKKRRGFRKGRRGK